MGNKLGNNFFVYPDNPDGSGNGSFFIPEVNPGANRVHRSCTRVQIP